MIKRQNSVKRNFWILTFVFTSLTVIGLFALWIDSTVSMRQSSMMNGSMGSMMSREHIPLNLSELFVQVKEDGITSEMNMSGHHESKQLLEKIHFATTATIVTLIPLIIGLLAFLLILWL